MSTPVVGAAANPVKYVRIVDSSNQSGPLTLCSLTGCFKETGGVLHKRLPGCAALISDSTAHLAFEETILPRRSSQVLWDALVSVAIMRLMHYNEHGKLSLTLYPSEDVPPYAILSHTWGLEKDEISFQDMQSNAWKRKKGREKLDFCVKQAKEDRLRYFWIDTCCINKSDKTEVLDAIMSMFRWYANAEVCYVYMSDVTTNSNNACTGDDSWKTEFHTAKWFTRGWTLQELLAPKFLRFFSRQGQDLGTKFSLLEDIHEITTVPRRALCGTPMSEFTVMERMQWALHRQTTKAEDRAYCLTGILGIFIVFLYGEEKHAYHRVMEAIVTKYRNSLCRLERPPPHIVASFALRSSILAPGQYEKELCSLDFDQKDARRYAIPAAAPATCTWLLNHPAYVQWSSTSYMQDHHGLLMLNGKAGTGKSTLMKFAHTAASQSRGNNELAIPFFFNARGNTLESSTSGMYRSLLVELLKQAPDLSASLENLSAPQANGSWSTHDLSRLFAVTLLNFIVLNYQAASKHKRVLKFFIDALDECSEDEVRDMVSLFEQIGSEALRFRTEVYVCFASRHYPTIRFQHGRSLVLEQQNVSDISEFVQARLGKIGPKRPAIADAIVDRSYGSFLWVLGVVRALNRAFDRGQGCRAESILRQLPYELSDFFKEMLSRDTSSLDGVLLALQWILFAMRLLTGEEFYFATRFGSSPATLPPTRSDENVPILEDIGRYVARTCRGLAEATPYVDFIHESLRDFLLLDRGLSELFTDVSSDQYSYSYDRWRQCCDRYLQAAVSARNRYEHLHDALAGAVTQRLDEKYPFLQYASEFIWDHGELAGSVDFFGLLDPATCLAVINRDQFRFGGAGVPQGLREFLKRRNSHRLIKYLSEYQRSSEVQDTS